MSKKKYLQNMHSSGRLIKEANFGGTAFTPVE
jgi:hypothetical protein